LRTEAHTIIEKTFNGAERRGSIPVQEVPKLIMEMGPGIDRDELDKEVHNAERRGSGCVDWPGFNRVAMHFIEKQVKQNEDQFAYKKEFRTEDFETR